MLSFIPEFLRTPVAFAVVLGVLVFIHELGHYLAARWRGVHVEAFSIGFGRALTSWTDRHGTVWKLAWLPLGGYVKMHGQERPEEVTPEERAAWRPGQTFHEKSVGSRAIIVAAGPVANFLLAIVLFAALFLSFGRPITLAVVGEVMPDSAAAKAGLLAGDRIEIIGDQPIRTFEDLQHIITVHPGEAMTLTIRREETLKSVPVTVGTRDVNGRPTGQLGIRAGKVEYQPVGPLEALWGGATQTWTVTTETLAGLGQMISGQRGTEELGGPLRIAQLSGQVAELGFASLVTFIAVLSVNLGLINLFPVPVLDGGHLLFYIVEAVLGRPLPRRAQEYGFRAGLAVLACLFIFATWNDLAHFGLMRWVKGLMG